MLLRYVSYVFFILLQNKNSLFTHSHLAQSFNVIMKEEELWPEQRGNLVISPDCHLLGSAAMAEEIVFIKMPTDLQSVDNPQNPLNHSLFRSGPFPVF